MIRTKYLLKAIENSRQVNWYRTEDFNYLLTETCIVKTVRGIYRGHIQALLNNLSGGGKLE